MKTGAKIRRTDIWREGKWLDLWSVVHFLSGVLVAFGLYLFKFGFLASTIIAFLMLVAYELWEAMVQIEETPQNRSMDVVVGMASFLPAFVYLAPSLSYGTFMAVFALVFVVDVAMSTSGWRASQKAAVLEEKLHTEYMEQRARMLERKIRRRELALRRRMARRARKVI